MFFRADGPDPFGSCETVRKPYDGFVMRVLLVLASQRHGFTIMSDGPFDQEWGGALKWFDRTIGHPYRKERIRYRIPGLDEPQTEYRLSF